MEVNDLQLQSDQSLGVQHSLIDISAKFQVPIPFLVTTPHKIVFMQKKSVQVPPPLTRVFFFL